MIAITCLIAEKCNCRIERYQLFRALNGLLMLLAAASLSASEVPDFVLEGLDGEDHHLNEYIGKGSWVVLNVWAPTCPPCVEEIPELVLFHDEHFDHGAMVVGLALDYPGFTYGNRGDVEIFVEQYLIGYPVLLGDRSTAEKIINKPIKAIPFSVLFRPDGKKHSSWIGTITQRELEAKLDFARQRD